MADAILDELKALTKKKEPEKEKERELSPREKEFSGIEAIIEKARASFLEDEDLALGDIIGTIASSLGDLIKPTEEEENEQIVKGIAETKSKKLATIGEGEK